MEHTYTAALRGLAHLLDGGPAQPSRVEVPTTHSPKGQTHETSIRSDVQAGLPDRRVGVRPAHDSDPCRQLPVDPVQRGEGNVVRVSSTCPSPGRKNPHADAVCATGLCAVHASGRGRFFDWISAISVKSSRSIRSSWVSSALCWTCHATGSIRGSTTLCPLLCLGLDGFAGGSIKSGCRLDINPMQHIRAYSLEVQHASLGDTEMPPRAYGWHADLEESCNLSGSTKGIYDLCCWCIHAVMLAQANKYCKPKLTDPMLG